MPNLAQKSVEKPAEKPAKKRMEYFVPAAILLLAIILCHSLYTIILSRRQSISELQNLAVENAVLRVRSFFEDQKINLLLGSEENDLSLVDSFTLADLVGSIKAKVKYTDEIAIIDRNGFELIKIPGMALSNVASADFFRAALSGRSYFGPVSYDNGSASVMIAEPIRNKDDAIVGVVAAKSDIRPLLKDIGAIRTGSEGHVFLTDVTGWLIGGDGVDQSVRQSVRGVLRRMLLSGVVTKGTFRYNENNILYATQWLNSDIQKEKTVNWLVISEWPKSDAYRDTNRLIYSCLVLFGLIILIFAVSWYVRKAILKAHNRK